jgi:dihydropteroate synthase
MTINCKGNLIDLSTPKIMGILNVTPDSFYDGGNYKNNMAIISQVKTMIDQGATFIDVGGYSSRPGADDVSLDEELERVIPIIELILNEFPDTLISIDTFRSQVAKNAIEAGACMVNDISSGHLDEQMLKTVAHLKVPYIMMHMRGHPKTMATLTNYDDVVKEVLFYFSERIAKARDLGIIDLIIDPGFGFAKTIDQNYELLNNFELLKMANSPILAGLSRKSMIYKTLHNSSEDALNGTTVLNTIALQKGAHILRVHDVKEAMECVKLTQQLK